VTEDVCGFVELVKTNAETISTCILNKLREWGFDLTRLRGQGLLDLASNQFNGDLTFIFHYRFHNIFTLTRRTDEPCDFS
jgi:hypothetical protein